MTDRNRMFPDDRQAGNTEIAIEASLHFPESNRAKFTPHGFAPCTHLNYAEYPTNNEEIPP